MANQWFKFYGGEYLGDQKILGLSAAERSCWITLLCYASQSNGVIKHLNEERLMTQAGVDVQNDEWERTKGVFTHFRELGMIAIFEGKIRIRNWKKRQETYLTDAERAQRYREKQKQRDGRVTKVTLEENRIEENRIEKKEKPTAGLSFLETLPTQDLQELSEAYKISPRGVQSKADDLADYCRAHGKKYKDYKAFLRNAIKADQVKLRNEFPLKVIQKVEREEPLTEEQREKNSKNLQRIRELTLTKTIT